MLPSCRLTAQLVTYSKVWLLWLICGGIGILKLWFWRLCQVKTPFRLPILRKPSRKELAALVIRLLPLALSAMLPGLPFAIGNVEISIYEIPLALKIPKGQSPMQMNFQNLRT